MGVAMHGQLAMRGTGPTTDLTPAVWGSSLKPVGSKQKPRQQQTMSRAGVDARWSLPGSSADDAYVTSERFGIGPARAAAALQKSHVVTEVPRVVDVHWTPPTDDRAAWTSSALDMPRKGASANVVKARQQQHQLKQLGSVAPPQDAAARAAALATLREATELLASKVLAPAEAQHATRAAAAAASAAFAAAAEVAPSARAAHGAAGLPWLVLAAGGIGLLGLLLIALRR